MKILHRSTLLATTVLAALALASCASGSTDAPEAGTSPAGGTVSIKHIYGETTFEKTPQHIATISWVNADALLALGTVPAGMDTDTWGQNTNNSTDWKDAALAELDASIGSDAAPAQYDATDGIDYTGIAASKPDAIFAAYSGLSQDEYDKLSKIAPVIGPLEANYLADWQDVTHAAGQLLGKEDEADELVEDLESKLAAQSKTYQQLEDATFIASDLSVPGTISIYAGGDNRPEFLSALGMKQAEVVTKNTPDGAFYFEWSPERAGELDADVMFASIPAGKSIEDVVASDKLLGQIPAVKTGAVAAAATDQQVLSVSAASPLSIDWAIEHVVPVIAQAAQHAADAK